MAIDDFSRELYAAIFLDKTQDSARIFLEQVLEECPYTIGQYYTDKGKEYRGDPNHHAFMTLCREHRIEQRFTKVKTPRTNGKAERVIKTIMEMWHNKTHFSSSVHRNNELRRFIKLLAEKHGVSNSTTRDLFKKFYGALTAKYYFQLPESFSLFD